MGTILFPTLHRQTLQQNPPCLPPPPSPPLTANPRRRNVQNQSQFSMRLTDLSLRRITAAAPFQFRFNHHHHHNQRPSSLPDDITSIYPKSMADESKKTNTQPENAVSTTTTLNLNHSKYDKQKESEKSTPPVPPPPEKPLPGDCCGSGCVRCVWDVYYEELEEYNRLYKAN